MRVVSAERTTVVANDVEPSVSVPKRYWLGPPVTFAFTRIRAICRFGHAYLPVGGSSKDNERTVGAI